MFVSVNVCDVSLGLALQLLLTVSVEVRAVSILPQFVASLLLRELNMKNPEERRRMSVCNYNLSLRLVEAKKETITGP